MVVGSAQYSASHTSRIQSVADSDLRIVLLGGVWDGLLLDQLYAHAYSYIHGHSVGGTNPSLLRARGAGTATIAFDVNFNRDVLGHEAKFFPAFPPCAHVSSQPNQTPPTNVVPALPYKSVPPSTTTGMRSRLAMKTLPID